MVHFNIVRAQAEKWVIEDHFHRGFDWTCEMIPDDMKTFFTESGEGRFLYDILRAEHNKGLEKHREERKALAQKWLICSLVRKMANIFIENAGLVVSRPSIAHRLRENG
jgi:hypothetical protein